MGGWGLGTRPPGSMTGANACVGRHEPRALSTQTASRVGRATAAGVHGSAPLLAVPAAATGARALSVHRESVWSSTGRVRGQQGARLGNTTGLGAVTVHRRVRGPGPRPRTA